ncbi:hypothetical protein Bca52824_066162 [Brassica carinata]|uniref:Uncharacterized protein n=1 Tax=Brassica carinata TaxID=52824 RepID=A0A8X7UAB3_BRACI|nr:hypothetical protein Bca52824_066162 [Brassica carinata]
MSKRSASSTPSMTNRAGSRRRVDSPVSRSDSSPDPDTGSEYDLAAPLPYAYASPPSIGNMSGNTSNDPFAAYQEAAKLMSAKKGSASRTVSGGDVVITGSHRVATTKKSRGGGMTTRSLQQSAEATNSMGNLATALSSLNLQVFPQDGTILPSGEPSEVVQVLQGGLIRTISQLFHFGEQLSIESSLVSKEELDDLKRQVSEEKA